MERKKFINKTTIGRVGTAGVLAFTAFACRAHQTPEHNKDTGFASGENALQLNTNLIRDDKFAIHQKEKPIQGPIPPTYGEEIEQKIKVIQQKIDEEAQKQKELEAKQLQVQREVQIAAPSSTENVGSAGGNIEPVTTNTSNNSGLTTQMHISGYYCQYDSGYYGDGGGFCGAMSDGQIAHLGAAACGPGYPLGTEFEIQGYGAVICEDRGGGIGDNDIDVFVPYSSQLANVPQGYVNVTEVK